ncbi:MAG: NAD(P)/FAD-dependent oxidoreductase [Anaerolineaceae bacterium]|nr:NAD(P)/FAD-dependent oxidoreductase [Anaerolineaceae bacterium]
MSDYDVIVIGAGLGGISAGALLARQGRRVLVLEQSERIGGCCSTFEKDGFHFDVGASIVEIVRPIEMAFEMLGTDLYKEVDLIPCDPIMTFLFPDGSRVTYPLSVEKTGELIASMSPEDGRRWNDFVAFASELMEVTLNTFFIEPASTAQDMLRLVRKDPRFLKFLPVFLSSYQDVLGKFFKNEKVLQTMGYQSLYFGLPPALVPGPYAMVPYTEHVGIYYPRGGMIKIPEAFQRVGEGYGMQVRLNSRVSRLLVEKRRVYGVQLADGTAITAPLVVSDINARTLYLKMIGAEHLPGLARRGISSYAYSKAVPMIYLGLDGAPDLNSHHSVIAISPDEINRYWWEHVERGRMPDENFGLICWPTHSDSSLAPEGCHVINLIPEGFYHLAEGTWEEEKPRFIERSLDYYSRSAVPGLKERVKVVECSTPLDFERRLLLPEGAIYAFQQDLPAEAVFRPAARSKVIDGLYLTGSSTHPGGGVPTTIASGIIASRLIEKYEQ